MAGDNDLQWQAKVEEDHERAKNYVDGITQDFNAQAVQLLGATQTAYNDYTEIMKAQSHMPIWVDLLINLFIFVAPELAAELVPAAAMSRSASAVSAFKHTLPGVSASFETGLTQLKKDMQHISKKYSEAVLIKLKSGELMTMANELNEKGEARKNQSSEQAQIGAGNMVIKQMTGNMLDYMQMVRDLIVNVNEWLVVRRKELLLKKDMNLDMLMSVKNDFRLTHLDVFSGKKVGSREQDILSDQILYDMINEYVKTYVSFTIVKKEKRPFSGWVFYDPDYDDGQATADAKAFQTRRLQDLPTYREQRWVHGLTEAQREAIYDRFGRKNAFAAIGRAVDDYKDLIFWMGAKMIDQHGTRLNLTSGVHIAPIL